MHVVQTSVTVGNNCAALYFQSYMMVHACMVTILMVQIISNIMGIPVIQIMHVHAFTHKCLIIFPCVSVSMVVKLRHI